MADALLLSTQATADFTTAAAYAKERGRLLAFLRRRLHDLAEAEDILQDTFTQLVEATDPLNPIAQVGSWLFKVARRKVIDSYRRQRPVPLPEVAVNEADVPRLGLDELLPDADADPEAAYLKTLFWEALEEALTELPDAQREVFELHELEGMPFAQIQELTGAPLGTLLSRKRYAVQHLRRRLQSFYDEFFIP